MFLLTPLFLILLGLALRMAMNLVYGVRGPSVDDVAPTVVKIISWFFICLGLLSVLGLLVVSVIGIFFFIVFWVIAGFAIVDAVRASRESHRQMNAKLLSIALREGRLNESLDLLRHLRLGYFVGGSTRYLCYDLQTGVPLYESSVRNRRALPRETPAYAAVGSLASDEPAAFEELSQPTPPTLAVAWRSWFDYGAYALGMMLMMTFVLTFLLVKIVPQFRNIFDEFDLALPRMTEVLIAASYYIEMFYFLIYLPLGLVLIGLPVIGLFYLCDREILRGFITRLQRRTTLCDALRLIAFGIEHKVELRRVLYALAVTYPSRFAQDQLNNCYLAVESGMTWTDALSKYKVLKSDEQALVHTAEQVGNVPWALRQIAHRRELASAMWLNFISKIFSPLMILFFAGIIAFIVISLFVPLVKLVNALA